MFGIGEIIGWEFTYGCYPACISWSVAGGSMGKIVWAPEGMHQPQGILMIGLRVIDPEDALGAAVHKDEVDLLGNLFISLFPRNGFKSISNPFQRAFNSIRTVKIMKIPVTLRANDAEISIGLRIPFNLPEPSILHVGEYPATISTSITDRRDKGHGSISRGLSPRLEIEKVRSQRENTRPRYGCF
jgi:hypothetical protein